MPKIDNIELSEDEVLMAEDIGLGDYVDYDDIPSVEEYEKGEKSI